MEVIKYSACCLLGQNSKECFSLISENCSVISYVLKPKSICLFSSTWMSGLGVSFFFFFFFLCIISK